MATVIDTLILELGIDPKNLNKGQRESVDTVRKIEDEWRRAGTGIEKSAQNTSQSIGMVQSRLLGLLAIFTAGKGIKSFIGDITTANAETGWLSRTLDTSIEVLSTWRNMATLVGGSAAGMTASVQGLVSQFETFSLTGESSVIPYFRALGVQISDTEGHMRSVDDIMLDLASRFETMNPARAATFARALGFDQGTINLLLQGRKAVEEMIAVQKELGIVTEADAKASQELMRSWGMLMLSSESTGRSIMTTLTPAIVKVLDTLLAVAKWAKEHPHLIEGALLAVGAVLAGLAIAFAGTATLITAGIALLIGAFALLYDDWSTWVAGGKSLFGGFYDFLAKLFRAIRALFTGSGEEIRASWKEVFESVGKITDKFIETLKNLAPRMLRAIKEGFSDAGSFLTGRLKALWEAIVNEGMPAGTPGSPSTRRGIQTGSLYPEAQSDIDSLVSKGWTEEQATGIVANLHRESSGRPDAVGDGGKAYGLAQWHPDRQAAFKAWAGKDIRQATREEQLAFIDYEMRAGNEQFAGRKLMQAKTAREAAEVVSKYYERPHDREGEAARRGDLAAGIQLGASGASGFAAMTASNDYSRTSSTTVQSETNIGTINVQTQATDADGIARDLKPALERNSFAQQANYGPT